MELEQAVHRGRALQLALEDAKEVNARWGEHLKVIEEERKKGIDLLAISQQHNPQQRRRWSEVLEMMLEDDGRADDRKNAGQSSKDCSVLGTYVDDCELDADARWRATVWRRTAGRRCA